MKFVSSMALLLKAGLLLLLAARVCHSVTGCDRQLYETVINDFCLEQFQLDMGRLNSGLWCTWPETMEIYEGLTNCTYQLALRMDCFWPNRVVDGFFMQIHHRYFHHCPSTGRLLREPPISILAPFIGVSVLITLLMTAVVVWRSKRTQGMLC
ncbi:receptor activity-modifying protein 1-like [Girardinichthys multiradiatus]|uniref:receptor activity-modifying protein 1-like n=1 Tax=Girardinichthys multiradiatus TaxID=208333 RepID=UPI001FADAE8B|nr:receptor activity-modifying protein 1-like [Girardinichthys multiradiatus]XP_047211571.1 receptor activity-modifying protein 1-like [Girardinichthys multiradiatus]